MKRSRDGGGGGGGRGQPGGGRGEGRRTGGLGRGGHPLAKRNPPRGGPGMLLTCEAGREGKCMREGLDVLRHYYYASIEGRGGDDAKGGREVDRRSDEDDAVAAEGGGGKGGEKEGRKELSLEEEIALLRGGASADEVLSSSKKGDGDERTAPGGGGGGGGRNKRRRDKASWPFSVYETGCKGSVFVLCTLPNCNLVAIDEKEEENGGGGSPAAAGGGNVEADSNDTDGNDKSPSAPADPDVAVPSAKRVKVDGGDAPTDATPPQPQSPPWDPIETVRRVARDLMGTSSSEGGGGGGHDDDDARASSKDAPSSRFVTRMIPIQATCFASAEEIRRTARPLLRRYLLPAAEERWREHQSMTTSEEGNVEEGGEGGNKEAGNEKTKTKKATTFKIEFKRRNCSKVRRDQVIDVVAKLVGEMVPSHQAGMLEVDLADPDYTIQIEVCRNICGLSVVPMCGSFGRKFNLIEMREGADDGI